MALNLLEQRFRFRRRPAVDRRGDNRVHAAARPVWWRMGHHRRVHCILSRRACISDPPGLSALGRRAGLAI